MRTNSKFIILGPFIVKAEIVAFLSIRRAAEIATEILVHVDIGGA